MLGSNERVSPVYGDLDFGCITTDTLLHLISILLPIILEILDTFVRLFDENSGRRLVSLPDTPIRFKYDFLLGYVKILIKSRFMGSYEI